MMATLLFFLPSPEENTRKENAAYLLLSIACIVFWPLFLLWISIQLFSLWFREDEDSDSES